MLQALVHTYGPLWQQEVYGDHSVDEKAETKKQIRLLLVEARDDSELDEDNRGR